MERSQRMMEGIRRDVGNPTTSFPGGWGRQVSLRHVPQVGLPRPLSAQIYGKDWTNLDTLEETWGCQEYWATSLNTARGGNRTLLSRSPPSGRHAWALGRFSRVWLRDPMDCSPPGSSVHGVLQARILEWVATPSSRGSSRPRDRAPLSYVSCVGRQVLYH